MAKTIIYRDRGGVWLATARWVSLRADLDYVRIRAYDNGKMRAIVEWIGKAIVEKGSEAYAAMFELAVENIISTDAESGEKLAKPKYVKDVSACEKFRTEAEAIAAYEDLVVRYAGCEWVPSEDPSGFRLLERGNKLAPLDKNVPVIEDGMDETNYGSW